MIGTSFENCGLSLLKENWQKKNLDRSRVSRFLKTAICPQCSDQNEMYLLAIAA